jgi:hypothetical protein
MTKTRVIGAGVMGALVAHRLVQTGGGYGAASDADQRRCLGHWLRLGPLSIDQLVGTARE